MSYFTNDKARNAQVHSFAGFLASLSGIGIASLVSLCLFFLLVSTRYTRVFVFPSTIFGTYEAISPRSLVRRLYTQRPEDCLPNCGREGTYLLRYLNFLLLLFGSSSLILTPSLITFIYFVSPSAPDTDLLHRFNWSSIASQSPACYWFYACLLPLFVCYILLITTRELKAALKAHPDLSRSDDSHACSDHYLLVSDLYNAKLSREILLECYSRWTASIVSIRLLKDPKSLVRSVEALRTLLSVIEERECTIIQAKQAGSTNTEGASKRQDAERQPPWWTRSIARLLPLQYRLRMLSTAKLYEEFAKFQRHVQNSLETDEQGAFVSLLRINNGAVARRLCQRYRFKGERLLQPRYIGPSVDGVRIGSLTRSWRTKQFSRILGRSLISIAAIIWTAPMSAASSLAHLTYLLKLNSSTRNMGLPPTWLLGVIQGVLPPLITTLLTELFLLVLQLVLQLMHFETTSELVLARQTYYFTFLFLQMFVATSISTGCIPAIVEVLNSGITQLPLKLATTLPLASDYFVSLPLVNALTLAVLSLTRVKCLAQWYIARRRSATPRQHVQALTSLFTDAQFGTIYSLYSVLTISALAYSLIAPLVLTTTSLGLLVTNLVYRYLLNFTVVDLYDTNALSYFAAMRTIFVGIYTMELCCIGLFLLRLGQDPSTQSILQMLLLLCTLFLTVQYHVFHRALFDPLIEAIPPLGSQRRPWTTRYCGSLDPYASDVTLADLDSISDASILLPEGSADMVASQSVIPTKVVGSCKGAQLPTPQ